MALVTEIPARLLCTFVPRLLGVRIMRSLGWVFTLPTLANSSSLSCAEGSPVGELARLLGVSMMGELLGPGVFGIFFDGIRGVKESIDEFCPRVGL